jgi:hypothetical protein
VLRRIHRDDDRWELTCRFVGIHEKTEDLIRRHVFFRFFRFFRLRTLRARGLL